jgi:hypothetical protein
MAAERNSRGGGVAAGAAQVHVADGILLMPQAKSLAPFQEQGARGDVRRRQRQAAVAARRGHADGRDLHQRLPQALGID